ncbi:mediator of RNA polymerase II transcription subunit 6-like [Protopterus annectens]|uniref:mediator of RNA polymerase II transcription subunit 6-like n=1 Tax=Protopterus annectens TaxID=7888 RepID=UPI001CFAC677|nr:mediator of RNA polymerase II transcription subunit 6-like [Protopterus annectens]
MEAVPSPECDCFSELILLYIAKLKARFVQSLDFCVTGNVCTLKSMIKIETNKCIYTYMKKLTAVHGIQSAFDEAVSYCRYHPSKGYWWHFKDQEERDKLKPKTKKKEEPSSFFQRQKINSLLYDLRQRFQPKFVQQKVGERPIPVEQIKKETVEPVPETIKQEPKDATKPPKESSGAKGPPEKKMRVQ